MVKVKDFVLSAPSHVNGPYANISHVTWRPFTWVTSMCHKLVNGMCVGGIMWYVVIVMTLCIGSLVTIGYSVSGASMCGVKSAHV